MRLWGRVRPKRLAALVGLKRHVFINGRRFYFDPQSAVGSALSKRGGFEAADIALAKRYVSRDSVVLDIGANIGIYSAHLAGLAAQVIAVEPQVNTLELLARNVSHLPNVTLISAVLSDVSGNAQLLIASDGAYSGLRNTGQRPIIAERTVLSLTGDDLVGMLALPRLDFVKIDVESHEAAVLRGMRASLERFRPVVLCEITGEPQMATIDSMRSSGFDAYCVRDGVPEPVGALDARYANYLFLPTGRGHLGR